MASTGRLSVNMLMFAVAACSLSSAANALHNNLSLTPVMGFNNWDEMPLHYKPWIGGFNESEVKRVGAALISTGMAAKGFVYVNLDCGWSTGYRDKSGQLQVNVTLFPSAAGGKGLEPLATHLHELNLKLGIYTSGHQCCSPKDGTKGTGVLVAYTPLRAKAAQRGLLEATGGVALGGGVAPQAGAR